MHRTLGWFGASLAAFKIGLGLATAVSMDNFYIHSDGTFPAASFLNIQVMDIVCFAIPSHSPSTGAGDRSSIAVLCW